MSAYRTQPSTGRTVAEYDGLAVPRDRRGARPRHRRRVAPPDAGPASGGRHDRRPVRSVGGAGRRDLGEMGKPRAGGRRVKLAASIYRWYADTGPHCSSPKLGPGRAETVTISGGAAGRGHALELPYYQVARFAAPNLMAATRSSSNTPRSARRAPRSSSRSTARPDCPGRVHNVYASSDQVAQMIPTRGCTASPDRQRTRGCGCRRVAGGTSPERARARRLGPAHRPHTNDLDGLVDTLGRRD